MPRKTAPDANVDSDVDVKTTSSLPAAIDPRPGASVSPHVVNVFDKAVSPGAAPGLRLAPLGGRPAGDALALSVVAWVRNIAYDKDVWMDLSLLEGDTEVLHTESVPLAYQEPAEGGGDFFAVGAAVPAPKAASGTSPASTLQYRIYAQMNGQLFTDGILHTHDVAAAAPASAAPAKPAKTTAPKPAASKPAAAAKPAKPKTSTAKPPAASKPATAPKAKPRTPKA